MNSAIPLSHTLGTLRDQLLDKHRELSTSTFATILFQLEAEVRRLAFEEAARIAMNEMQKGLAK